MKQIAILIMGEYDCYDAYIRHENESHTASEWRDLYRNENCHAEIWRFDTPEELACFLKGVEAVDGYVSSDYYTAYVQTERITGD